MLAGPPRGGAVEEPVLGPEEAGAWLSATALSVQKQRPSLQRRSSAPGLDVDAWLCPRPLSLASESGVTSGSSPLPCRSLRVTSSASGGKKDTTRKSGVAEWLMSIPKEIAPLLGSTQSADAPTAGSENTSADYACGDADVAEVAAPILAVSDFAAASDPFASGIIHAHGVGFDVVDGAFVPGVSGALRLERLPTSDRGISVALWEYYPEFSENYILCVKSGSGKCDTFFRHFGSFSTVVGRVHGKHTREFMAPLIVSWTHHVFVFARSCVRWFINGQLCYEAPETVDLSTANAKVYAGNRPELDRGGIGSSQLGSISVYARPLSATEVGALANRGCPGPSSVAVPFGSSRQDQLDHVSIDAGGSTGQHVFLPATDMPTRRRSTASSVPKSRNQRRRATVSGSPGDLGVMVQEVAGAVAAAASGAKAAAALASDGASSMFKSLAAMAPAAAPSPTSNTGGEGLQHQHGQRESQDRVQRVSIAAPRVPVTSAPVAPAIVSSNSANVSSANSPIRHLEQQHPEDDVEQPTVPSEFDLAAGRREEGNIIKQLSSARAPSALASGRSNKRGSVRFAEDIHVESIEQPLRRTRSADYMYERWSWCNTVRDEHRKRKGRSASPSAVRSATPVQVLVRALSSVTPYERSASEDDTLRSLARFSGPLGADLDNVKRSDGLDFADSTKVSTDKFGDPVREFKPQLCGQASQLTRGASRRASEPLPRLRRPSRERQQHSNEFRSAPINDSPKAQSHSNKIDSHISGGLVPPPRVFRVEAPLGVKATGSSYTQPSHPGPTPQARYYSAGNETETAPSVRTEIRINGSGYKPALRASDTKASWDRYVQEQKATAREFEKTWRTDRQSAGRFRHMKHFHHHHHANGPILFESTGVNPLLLPPVDIGSGVDVPPTFTIVAVQVPEPLPAPASVIDQTAPASPSYIGNHDYGGAIVAPTSPPPPIPAHSLVNSLPPTASMAEGAMLGIVATLAIEAVQAVTADDDEKEYAARLENMKSSLLRGAGMGATGASLAFACGPLAPTAAFVTYSITREWMDHYERWRRREITHDEAQHRATEAVLGAFGGVTAAWSAAALLAGSSAVTVAAIAACCSLAGNVGGRNMTDVVMGLLESGQLIEDPELTAAYAELGVLPGCTNDELRRAFRRGALQRHPDKVGGEEGDFNRLQAAMDKIRFARGQGPFARRYREMQSALDDRMASDPGPDVQPSAEGSREGNCGNSIAPNTELCRIPLRPLHVEDFLC